MIIFRYFNGLRGLLAVVAVLAGITSLTAAIAFFLKVPVPIFPISVEGGLVATSTIFVVVVILLWSFSLPYWFRTAKMEFEYWRERADQQMRERR